jgi:hypothetical protein
LKRIRIGLVQMRCEKGAVAQNLAATAACIQEAAAHRVDVLAFPEASLSGYVEPARYPHAVLRLDGPEVTQALSLTRGYALTALMGIIEARPGDKPYITQLVVRDGELASPSAPTLPTSLRLPRRPRRARRSPSSWPLRGYTATRRRGIGSQAIAGGRASARTIWRSGRGATACGSVWPRRPVAR